jgi:putative endonuclease
MRVKDAVGRFGEDVAVAHLRECGLQVLERNWRCAAGEVDVVALDGNVLAFVEVKTRSRLGFGTPAEAITGRKLARMRRVAACWLAEHPGPRRWSAVRLDVVSVVRITPDGPSVEHLRGVGS